MQKRKNVFKTKKFTLKLLRRKKLLHRYKHKVYFRLLYLWKRIRFRYFVTIRIRSNNMFCHVIDLRKKTTLLKINSGFLKIKITKKRINYVIKPILNYFFDKINLLKIKKSLLFSVIVPARNRRLVLKHTWRSFNTKRKMLFVVSKKCFNGCRPPKKRRKKRQGLRLFK